MTKEIIEPVVIFGSVHKLISDLVRAKFYALERKVS